MHLTDSAVHQQLFLDVLNGTKVLVGAISSSISAALCHHRFFRCCDILKCSYM